MNVQTAEQLIINFLEYDFTNFLNYFSFFLDFGFLYIVSPVKSSDIAMFKALFITTLNELLDLALRYLQDYKSVTLDAKTFEKWLKYTSDEKTKSKLKTIDEFRD